MCAKTYRSSIFRADGADGMCWAFGPLPRGDGWAGPGTASLAALSNGLHVFFQCPWAAPIGRLPCSSGRACVGPWCVVWVALGLSSPGGPPGAACPCPATGWRLDWALALLSRRLVGAWRGCWFNVYGPLWLFWRAVGCVVSVPFDVGPPFPSVAAGRCGVSFCHWVLFGFSAPHVPVGLSWGGFTGVFGRGPYARGGDGYCAWVGAPSVRFSAVLLGGPHVDPLGGAGCPAVPLHGVAPACNSAMSSSSWSGPHPCFRGRGHVGAWPTVGGSGLCGGLDYFLDVFYVLLDLVYFFGQ